MLAVSIDYENILLTKGVCMSDLSFEIGQLSQMNLELNKDTLNSLRGNTGKYAQRLGKVATKTFMHSHLLGGTTIGGPSVLTYGRKNRLQEKVLKGTGMYVRNMPTSAGDLIMFPLHTIGLSSEGTPIIDPEILERSYTVLHAPKGSSTSRSNPAQMRADLAFTVDEDNLVTVNGQNTATIQELVLFDRIVTEFEQRAEILHD
jgi:hypothetical protein